MPRMGQLSGSLFTNGDWPTLHSAWMDFTIIGSVLNAKRVVEIELAITGTFVSVGTVA